MSLTVASLHYRCARFRLAAVAFDQASNDVLASSKNLPTGRRKRKRHCGDDHVPSSSGCWDFFIDGTEFFGTLPSLAASADAALCRARSALAATGEATSVSARSLLDAAVESNGHYMRALVSASMRLRRAEAHEAARYSSSDGGDKRKPRGSRFGAVVNVNRTQLACAAVMTGVSESWLHMALGDATGAEKSLIDAAKIAASSFWDDLAQERTMNGAVPVILPPELLRITSKEAIQMIKNCIDSDDERGCYAMKTFCTAVTAVELFSDQVSSVADKSGSAGTTAHLTARNYNPDKAESTERKEQLRKSTSETKCEYMEDDKLRVQECVMHALVQHKHLGDCNSSAHEQAAIQERRDDWLSKAIAARFDGQGGLARRLKILLNGMDLALHVNSVDCATPNSANVVKGLQSLVPVSGTACSLLGCILCAEGSFDKALDLFQKKLDMDEKSGFEGSPDHKETVSNMAHCFSALGDAKAAQELLLHALTQAPTIPQSHYCKEDYVPLQLLLSRDFGQRKKEGIRYNGTKTMLWRLYYISSLAKDWATCVASAEELGRLDDKGTAGWTAAKCSRAFALLQSHRPSFALDICTESRHCQHAPEGSGLTLLFNYLYKADALISAESGLSTNISETEESQGNRDAVLKACDLTNRADIQLDSFTRETVKESAQVSFGVLELEAIVKNNRGVALVMAGETSKSIRYFKDAALSAASLHTSVEERTAEIPYLQPHFNLALLLWREGHRHDAASVWISARRFGNGGSKPSNFRTSLLRSALQEAINHHALFCAERASREYGADRDHIPAWGAERKVPNMSRDQLYALDILVLQHAVAESSRSDFSKCSRKRDGSLR